MPALTKPHFEALGRITTAYAALDAEVSLMLWKLIDEDQRVAKVLTHRTRLYDKLDLLKDLALLRLGDDATKDDEEQIRDIIGEAKSAIRLRNRTVHAAWLVVDEEDQPVQWTLTKKKGTIESQLLKRSPDELNQESLALGEAREAIIEMRELLEAAGIDLGGNWL